MATTDTTVRNSYTGETNSAMDTSAPAGLEVASFGLPGLPPFDYARIGVFTAGALLVLIALIALVWEPATQTAGAVAKDAAPLIAAV